MERYQKAAADYLDLPLDDPEVVRLARKARQAADLAAFAVLREQGNMYHKNREVLGCLSEVGNGRSRRTCTSSRSS